MNIKRISRIMVLALTVSAAGSAVAFDGNTRTGRLLNTLDTYKWQIAGGASVLAVATALAIWQHAHVKKVKAEEAKKAAAEAEAAQKKQRTVRAAQPVRSQSKVSNARRTCSRSGCSRR